ncbi:MAG TPA: hypothetical protein VJ875_10775 [Pyrinomonadaceae bacterium]|nr:hypothetical protein [Pyrinomonadaceae bacterium]
MTNRFSASRSFLLVLLLGWTTLVSAQQTQKSLNYGFISPNTRTDLKLEEAIKGMSSAEESELRKKAINLSCVVRSRIQAFKALGSWSDGAEHSVMLRLNGDEPTLRYVLSRMGRDAQQKYVIYFHPQHDGKTDLYALRLPRRTQNFVALSNTLERAGIPFRTMVPFRGTTAIYVIDLDRDLRAKILAAARQLRARVTAQTGNAKLFGDDERQKASAVFEQEIKNYEAKHPNLPPTCDTKVKPQMTRTKRIL